MLAADKGLTPEELTKWLICKAIAADSLAGCNDVTITQLQGNIDAYFRLAEHQPIFIVDEFGAKFAVISTDELNRLSGLAATKEL